MTHSAPRVPHFSRPRNTSYRKRSRSPSDSPPRPAKRSRPRRKRSPSPAESPSDLSPTKERSAKKSFRNTSSPRPLSACPMCLGRHRHDVTNCDATIRWDKKSENRCSRGRGGHLKAPDGTTLCTNWQKPHGCDDSSHAKRHQCSGCGATDHGAQGCPRAEAAAI